MSSAGVARALAACALLAVARPQAHQIRSDWSLQDNEYVMAFVNVTYRDPDSSQLYYQSGEIGKFSTGLVAAAAGRLLHARSRNGTAFDGCDAGWELPPPAGPWVALVRRGRCNFDVKVENAFRQNASAVVIYDYKEARHLHRIHLAGRHRDTIVTIFIPKEQGEHLASLTDSGVNVTMQITPGKHVSYSVTNLNKTSVLFVSVSFILLMVISLAWLLFYYVQRFRYMHAKDRLAKRLVCAARKALSKIPVKTLKTGDEQLGEGDCCAVCLELYKVSEQLRMLPCSHEFHKVCVDPWLLKNRTCPMCKMDILKYYGLSSVSEESIVQLEHEERAERRSSSLEPALYVPGGRSPARSVSRASLQSMSLVMPSPACVESLHGCGSGGGGLSARSRRVSSVLAAVRRAEPPRRLSAPARPATAAATDRHEPLGRSHSSPATARDAAADRHTNNADGGVSMKPDPGVFTCCTCQSPTSLNSGLHPSSANPSSSIPSSLNRSSRSPSPPSTASPSSSTPSFVSPEPPESPSDATSSHGASARPGSSASDASRPGSSLALPPGDGADGATGGGRARRSGVVVIEMTEQPTTLT